MQFWNPDGFEFADRHQVTRTLYGCSTIGVFEFHDRMSEIQTILDSGLETETWQDIYHRDERLQHLVKRCLKLNGIKPKWVTLDMVETLLFRRQTSQGWTVGYLVELNRPKHSGSKDEPATLDQVIAAIATHTTTLAEAFELADTVPANQLQSVMQAKNDLLKDQDPEQKKQKQVKKDQGRSREQLQKMRQIAGVNGGNNQA